jgi:hypothetical protein
MSISTPDPTNARNIDHDTTVASGRPGPLTFPELFALPVTVDLTTAARALGISKNTAYRLISRNAFPCTIIRPTHRYRIPTASLMTALDIELQPVRSDDVTSGIEFATRTT